MLRRPGRLFLGLFSLVLVFDQISKSIVRVLWGSALAMMPLDGLVGRIVADASPRVDSISLIGNAVQITHVRNTGAAFGMLPGYRPVFVAASLAMLVTIAAYWRRDRPHAWPVVTALALIAGGAVGNLIDRLATGKVTDFIYAALIDFPVFNIADAAISVGVTILIGWLLFAPAPSKPEAHGEVEVASDDAMREPGDAHGA